MKVCFNCERESPDWTFPTETDTCLYCRLDSAAWLPVKPLRAQSPESVRRYHRDAQRKHRKNLTDQQRLDIRKRDRERKKRKRAEEKIKQVQ